MDIIFSILILGVVQGLTEFLPVSSSGHLVILRHLTGLKSDEITLEVVLHLGTLFAVLVFFRKKIWEILVSIFKNKEDGKKWVAAVIIGSIPAGIVGVLLENLVENTFQSILYPGIFLVVTGLLLLFFSSPKKTTVNGCPNLITALLVGFAQAFAILPGISRSGSTIVAGLQAGLDKNTAFEFSFLLSIPAVAGAGLLKIKDISSSSIPFTYLLVGFLVSGITGFACLSFLKFVIHKGRLKYFAPWCFVAGIVALILYF